MITPLARCCSLLLGWLLVVSLLLWLLPPAARAMADHPVLALYYPWYDPDSFGAVSDQPAVQLYESDAPALIRRQVEEAQSAGIDGFVAAWFGQGDRTDKNFSTLLGIAQDKGFSATIYFETDHILGTGPDAVVAQLRSFSHDYLDHPALVRYQGKPVIFFWRTRALDLATWASIRAEVDPDHRAVWIAEGDQFGQLTGDTFDGIHPYSIAWSSNPAATLARYGQHAHAFPGKLWIPIAMPGYDDARLRAGGFVVPRADGAYYRSTFQAALDSQPDWAVLITSWNEWLEGHQIEPSLSYGTLSLEITAQFAAQLHARGAASQGAG